MRRLVLLLALGGTVPAAGQTCGGFITIPLSWPHTHYDASARVDTLLEASAAHYQTTAFAIGADGSDHGGAPVVSGRPAPDAIRAAHPHLDVFADSLGDPHDGLFWPRDDLRSWTRCGYALLRYTLTIRTGDPDPPVMTLDLYNVPPHGVVRAEGAIPIRPGRWSFDFEDGVPLDAEHLRREPDG